MIRFSASLVVVALGLLVAGGVTSKLLLVYVAIAVSAIALVFLIIGAILDRGELRASSPAEAPDDRLDEASAGRLDRPPADDREEAGPGRSDQAPAADLKDAEESKDAAGPVGTNGIEDIRTAATAATAPTAASTASVADTKDPGDIADHTGPSDNLADTQSADQPVTVVPGVPRYHRGDCILIRFMGASDLQKLPVEAAKKNGCTPCRACHTDGEKTG